MDADIHTLYESDFYRVLDFKCRCTDCKTSKPEYGNSFCISFVRKGNFLFNVFRNSMDSYTGCVLVTKPGYEHTVTHSHAVPDECTIFDFKEDFYNALIARYGNPRFLNNNDVHSTLVHADAETEFLHYSTIRYIITKSATKLEIDNQVMEIAERTMTTITDYEPNNKINNRLKKNHLATVECAKEYIVNNFLDDISLMQLADHCHVSPFHFSRIFKAFTSTSPHRYLLSVRLKNTELLLRNTNVPIIDIAYSSGFNSIEHFSAAFNQKYNCPPGKYRHNAVI